MSLALLLGALLLITFVVSRITLWLTRSWLGDGVAALIVGHLLSLIVVAVGGGIVMANGGAFRGADAAQMYLAPQLFWLVVELIWWKVKGRGEKRSAQ